MATRQIESRPLETEADFEDVTDAVEDNERTEQDILTEIGASEDHADFECRVFQMPDTGTKRIWLFNVPGAQAKTILERLRDQYGTGTYEVRIWQTINGKTRPAKNHKQTIAIRRPETTPSKMDGANSTALEMMVRQQGEAIQHLLQRSTQPQVLPPAPAASDPVAMFGAMAAMAEAMRKIMGPPPAPVQQTNPFEMLQSVVQLVKQANEPEREKGVIEQVMDFAQSDTAKMIFQGFAQQPQYAQPQLPAPQTAQPPRAAPPQPQRSISTAPAPQAPQPRPSPQPQPTISSAPAETVAASDAPSPDVAQQLALSLDYLVKCAARGLDPITYAEWTWDNVDRDWLLKLLEFTDPVQAIAMYNPAAAPYREWFVAVVDVLQEMKEEEAEAIAETLATQSANAPPTISQAPGLTVQTNAGQMAGAHDMPVIDLAAAQRASAVDPA